MDTTIREYQDSWEAEIKAKLEEKFPGKIEVTKTETRRVYAKVLDKADIKAICKFVQDDLSFEHINCLCGVDYPAENKMQVIYEIDNYTFYRGVILELEGEEGFSHLDEYSDGKTERGRNLRRAICEKFNFSSLEFQTLEGVLEAIGLPECDVCTYCWNGKE